MPTRAEAEYLREEVEDAMGYSMDGFTFWDIIDCCNFNKDEAEWAKEYLGWSVKISEYAECRD